ncbi:TPA: hypothetical protein ACTLRO_003248 [Klebsiella pneumoniae]|uniref:hypothetical protein n=1 Tax=Klebsiella pneumoniae TaxID=573 RepID=UPI000DE77836|nr:hypothetical protein [Klebsiella pneumoniae]MCG6665205.1 hypothetical protein [Klebsiella pneumoniae]MCW8285575.1 hypothetical protein [Klebsiella pneumoniae]QSI56617.1 hypothetical protein HMI21_06495 [Klebsiella pneumoniae]QSI62179.1 hypothetical protein G4D19_06495 [Klebsiella pneumoniae]QSI67779.1 hypothetical protein G4I41_06725 [Klebsiella pneumoniae]
MNISTVNELIASLESAGDLSIREQKFLKLAKAYQQLAAENVALKESRNNLAEFIHEELDADYPLNMNLETHATDRIVAEAEARGVEKAIAHLEKKFSNIGVQIMNLQWLADSLREGADK